MFLKDMKVLPNKEGITQHKPLVCHFKIRDVKGIRSKLVPRRKIWELHKNRIR